MKDAPPISDAARQILKPLPRRAPIVRERPLRAPIRRRALPSPPTSILQMVRRMAAWGFWLAIFRAGVVADALRGRSDPAQTGLRLRRVFERLGGTAVKLGQQLSIRVDMLPFEVCEELGKLRSQMTPMSFDAAVGVIEAELGRPAGEIFSELEPEPIGSASIACVYRGRLASGERVAIKVRRPEVVQRFTEDLRCLDALTGGLELLGLVQPGFFANLRRDARTMFMEEMDFVREARYQRLFRREVRKQKVREFTAPRVFSGYSTDAVLVSEFIEGVSMADLVRAAETDDRAALGRLRQLGIAPNKTATRVALMACWGRFESPFFHADPHPGNIIVRPGGQLVLLDFGSCCHRPPRIARLDEEVFRRMYDDDISGAVDASLAMTSPLAPIDVKRMREGMERTFWRVRLNDLSRDGEWWERTTAALYVAIIEVTREFKAPVGSALLQIMRSALIYDTLSARLNPRKRMRRVYREQVRRSLRRRARQIERDFNAEYNAGALPFLLGEVEETARVTRQALYWTQHVTARPRGSFLRVTARVAYATTVLIRTLLAMATLTVGGFLLLWFRARLVGVGDSAWDLVQALLVHPAYLLASLGVVILLIRRISFRLRETDPGN